MTTTTVVAPDPVPRRDSELRQMARTVWSSGLARVGIVMLGFFVVLAIFAPWIAPYPADRSDFERRLPPSGAHWLGTTATGEDILSQLILGSRISLFVGLVAGAIATLVAITIGLAWGYTGERWGAVIDFFVNIFLVVPGTPLMIILAAYLANGGMSVIIFVIVITGWATGARVLRSQAATLRSRDFVIAARFSGDSAFRIIFREIMPNMISIIVANFIAAALGAIGAESSLAFLGLGDPNTMSWGAMLYWSQNGSAMLTGQWQWVFMPGLCIALLCVSLTFINFGLDAIGNPRLRQIRQPKQRKAVAK
jgi:peptide/nickel transport system permease protein